MRVTAFAPIDIRRPSSFPVHWCPVRVSLLRQPPAGRKGEICQLASQLALTPEPNPAHGASIVIPAWNEEDRLNTTLDRYLPTLETLDLPYEVIVVSDGSTDRTVEIATRFVSRGVRLLEFPAKLGKGGAIVEGLRVAKYDMAGFVDADGPIPAEDIQKLVGALSSYDCAIASRFLNGSVDVPTRALSRRILSRLWNLSVRALLGLPITDTQCGAKFLSISAFRSVAPRVNVTDWAFDVSLLFALHQSGFTIREIPVKWTEQSGSKLAIHRDAPRMLLSLIGVRLSTRVAPSPVRGANTRVAASPEH